MDEMTEIKNIWNGLEAHLSALNGEQTREYEIVGTDKNVIGKIDIPTEYDEDEIIEVLQEEFPALFNEEKEYCVSGDGQDGTIEIEEFNPDGPNTTIGSMTTYEDIEDFDQFMEDVLDIERTQYCSSGKWVTKEYTIVTGTGGPHVEFTTGYVINVYWGGKSLEMSTYDDGARATMDRVEEYLNDMEG